MLLLRHVCVCSVLQASSWVEQEQLDERLTDMEAQKAQLAADLQATQARAAHTQHCAAALSCSVESPWRALCSTACDMLPKPRFVLGIA